MCPFSGGSRSACPKDTVSSLSCPPKFSSVQEFLFLLFQFFFEGEEGRIVRDFKDFSLKLSLVLSWSLLGF